MKIFFSKCPNFASTPFFYFAKKCVCVCVCWGRGVGGQGMVPRDSPPAPLPRRRGQCLLINSTIEVKRNELEYALRQISITSLNFKEQQYKIYSSFSVKFNSEYNFAWRLELKLKQVLMFSESPETDDAKMNNK